VNSDFTEMTEMNEFICKNKPLLFVNVNGKEERVGNSFQNPNESNSNHWIIALDERKTKASSGQICYNRNLQSAG